MTRSEKPDTPSERPSPPETNAPEWSRGRNGKIASASATVSSEATQVMRSSCRRDHPRGGRGSPASIASVAQRVHHQRPHGRDTENTTSSGGNRMLSVRFAASTTWKSASATSRKSERRGRASRSWSAWVEHGEVGEGDERERALQPECDRERR